MSPKRSFVWNYFKRDKSDPQAATCTLCNKKLKCFNNTSNLKQHLIRIHPVVMMKSEPTIEEDYVPSTSTTITVAESNTGQLTSVVSEPSVSGSVENSVVCDSDKWPKLKIFGAESVAPSEAENNEIDYTLLKMIAKDFQPLSMVENEGFLEYTRALNKFYIPPKIKRLSRELLPEYYHEAASKLKNILSYINHAALTTDVWTSDSQIDYITVTAHFIHEDKLYSQVLSTKDLPIQHTSEDISVALGSILDEWQVEDKIVAVVSDSDVVKTINERLHKHHLPCVAHSLNLSVTQALGVDQSNQNSNTLSLILEKCRALVGYFKHSVLANDKLRATQENMGLFVVKVKQDVPTRWNSCYLMVERLLKLKEPLSVAVESLPKSPAFLTAKEWLILNDYVEVLKPANELVLVLSAETYPTISLIVPLIRGFQLTLKKVKTRTDVGEALKIKLLDIVTQRLGNLEQNKIVAKATFIDPRFKKLAFGTDGNASNAEKWITEELAQLVMDQRSFCNIKVEEIDDDDVAEPISSTSADPNDIWAFFDQKVSKEKALVTPTVTLMIQQYLEIPPLQRSKNPLEFWAVHRNILPELYQLAIKYLCIPGTSVPSGRVFSKVGQLATSRRNRLPPKHLDQIIFLNTGL